VLCLAITGAARLDAQSQTASISGRVTDAATGAPLAGADVAVDGTAFITSTDRTGAFRLSGLPAGDYSLLVLYLGHRDERASVTLTPGQPLTVDVKLAPSGFSEQVEVRAEPIGEGEAAALNQQRTALNITNIVSADQIGSFPDPNAAEAASRIPGVSIARDQGEGRYVLIRGTEPRLNSMLIDGERIPAPEGDLRQVALDAVPADQLQAIEVSKALTPDMDADAIGGAVNLVTKQAVSKPTALFSVAGGYNALQEDYDQLMFNGTAGRRFADGRLGVLVGGSGSNLHRGSENFEPQYDDGNLADLQLRDYQIQRERYGVNFAMDTRASANSGFIVRGIFNEFKDYEINNRLRFRPPNSRIEHVLKNRQQDQHIRSLSGTGQHVLGAATMEHQPNRLDTIFRQSRISFAPNVSPTFIDPENIQANPSANNPANATLNAWQSEIFKTTDRDVVGSTNLRFPLGASTSRARFLKFGVKVRAKDKDRDFTASSASPGVTVPFTQLQDASFDNSRFLDFFPAGYAPFPGISPDASRALYTSIGKPREEVDPESDASTYDADEKVYAGYAMAEFYVGDRLLLLPGVRYEATDVSYRGSRVIYDDGGDYLRTDPVSGGDSYGEFLPGFHVRYAFDPNTNLRAAYSKTLARPNYYDLVPYELVFQEDAEIERGNPNLKATTSNNLDVMLERYFRSVGVVSGGVFYKRLNDYIYQFRVQENVFNGLFDVTEPRNGDSATLWGLELVFQNQLRFLPSPLDGLGVYANYTWTDSSATFPDRTGDATLPGQSAHVGNVALWYEKAGFSGRVSWNFHGKYIDTVGGSAADDVYYDDHTQIDVNVSQRLTRNFRLFVDMLNLTNAPLRYYQGTWDRPVQEEYYRWWMSFGVRANF
jgi:outer membrane receptor protein involved in Fe transport